MIKATKDFVADGRSIKAGQVILPETLSADTLISTLLDRGLVEVIDDGPKPKKPDHEAAPQPKVKTGSKLHKGASDMDKVPQ